MKRIYTGVRAKWPLFSNHEISSLLEGIQNRGGEIISVNFSNITFGVYAYERVCIFYEDNEKFDEISEFLKDKEDNTKSWAYSDVK